MSARVVRIAKGGNEPFKFQFGDYPEIVAGQSLTGTPEIEIEDATLGTAGTPTISGTDVVAFIDALAVGECDMWVRCPTNVSPTILSGKTRLVVE